MHRISGIRFADGRFLNEFERETKRRLTPTEAQEILTSYTVHELAEGLILEFRDMNAVAGFLEKARAVDLAARTFRVVKLIAAMPTAAYHAPVTQADLWAKEEIERLAQEGRRQDSLIFSAEGYDKLRDDFETAKVPIDKYLR